MFSAIHQHESVTGTYTFVPPPLLNWPPISSSSHPQPTHRAPALSSLHHMALSVFKGSLLGVLATSHHGHLEFSVCSWVLCVLHGVPHETINLLIPLPPGTKLHLAGVGPILSCATLFHCIWLWTVAPMGSPFRLLRSSVQIS